ncbi:MAG: type secretion system family protein [Anaerosolibacter sp.]|uniref:type II secretion system F family protein n=1 Tax=Anaerosolibacter sp. TaxID=1872527 RepID=UPI0026378AF7|nr:type II secretion system F family protein [Anaerosolibacter sp.]MDF2548031.1 type secretion system family protein [Anaerosolibacter sp.]
MIYYTFFCTTTLLIMFFFSLTGEKKDRVQRRLSRFLNAEGLHHIKSKSEMESTPLLRRTLYPLIHELRRSFSRKISEEKEAQIETKLLQAGSPLGMTPVDYRLLQISCITVLPLIFGTIAFFSIGELILILLMIFLGFIMGLLLPAYYLQIKTKERSRQALRELPDVVDLLTVSLEAGLGFDSALSKLISNKDGILSREFHRCLEEIRLGKTRREALKGIRHRLLVDEISILISSILQAEKLGISMVQILRIQSHEVRQQRKQRAEEAAMKAPIKMLFPLVLFIFPSLFIVLLGPAVIQFITTFAKQ